MAFSYPDNSPEILTHIDYSLKLTALRLSSNSHGVDNPPAQTHELLDSHRICASTDRAAPPFCESWPKIDLTRRQLFQPEPWRRHNTLDKPIRVCGVQPVKIHSFSLERPCDQGRTIRPIIGDFPEYERIPFVSVTSAGVCG